VAQITESVGKVIDEFAKLPGIGRKSAERLAYTYCGSTRTRRWLWPTPSATCGRIVRYCKTCFNLSEGEQCLICLDSRRDQTQLCVVEQPRDLIAMEQTGAFRGLYHVLLGRIAPLDGVGPDQLTVSR